MEGAQPRCSHPRKMATAADLSAAPGAKPSRRDARAVDVLYGVFVVRVYMYIYIHISVYLFMCTHTYIYIYVYLFVFLLYLFIHIYFFVSYPPPISICVYKYIHMSKTCVVRYPLAVPGKKETGGACPTKAAKSSTGSVGSSESCSRTSKPVSGTLLYYTILYYTIVYHILLCHTGGSALTLALEWLEFWIGGRRCLPYPPYRGRRAPCHGGLKFFLFGSCPELGAFDIKLERRRNANAVSP